MNLRKSIITIVVLVVLFILSSLLYMLFSGMEEKTEDKQREEIKLFVNSEKVAYTTNLAMIVETGRLSSQHSVDLSAEVQGEILPGNVTLQEGAKFKKRDLLVRIFDEEARNNLKASKSRFLNAIAGILPDIRIDYPGSYKKYEDFFNSVKINEPLPSLPEADSDAEKIFLASRNILNDYFNIKSSEVRLSKYNLYAPFDGSFTRVFLEAGSVANPGSRIASMIRTDKMELEVPVRIDDAYWINVGGQVKVSTKDRNLSWTGTVVRKSDFMDPASQAITVFVALTPDKDKPLYQGQYLVAEFAAKTLKESMEIPRNAVFEKNKVFTVVDGKLKKAEITVLKTNETSVIFSGLPVGTDVVVEPLVNAKEGFNAEILDQP
ncbi:MAG: HlyD family efflux transporter periplasmic adaptor subunit [Bacteroidales bacterium]|nr:HlyD family efflux transporter periplasmic adaptor subunit [Bacteroidales bacterium]